MKDLRKVKQEEQEHDKRNVLVRPSGELDPKSAIISK